MKCGLLCETRGCPAATGWGRMCSHCRAAGSGRGGRDEGVPTAQYGVGGLLSSADGGRDASTLWAFFCAARRQVRNAGWMAWGTVGLPGVPGEDPKTCSGPRS